MRKFILALCAYFIFIICTADAIIAAESAPTKTLARLNVTGSTIKMWIKKGLHGYWLIRSFWSAYHLNEEKENAKEMFAWATGVIKWEAIPINLDKPQNEAAGQPQALFEKHVMLPHSGENSDVWGTPDQLLFSATQINGGGWSLYECFMRAVNKEGKRIVKDIDVDMSNLHINTEPEDIAWLKLNNEKKHVGWLQLRHPYILSATQDSALLGGEAIEWVDLFTKNNTRITSQEIIIMGAIDATQAAPKFRYEKVMVGKSPIFAVSDELIAVIAKDIEQKDDDVKLKWNCRICEIKDIKDKKWISFDFPQEDFDNMTLDGIKLTILWNPMLFAIHGKTLYLLPTSNGWRKFLKSTDLGKTWSVVDSISTSLRDMRIILNMIVVDEKLIVATIQREKSQFLLDKAKDLIEIIAIDLPDNK